MSLDSPRYTATHLLLESAKAITSGQTYTSALMPFPGDIVQIDLWVRDTLGACSILSDATGTVWRVVAGGSAGTPTTPTTLQIAATASADLTAGLIQKCSSNFLGTTLASGLQPWASLIVTPEVLPSVDTTKTSIGQRIPVFAAPFDGWARRQWGFKLKTATADGALAIGATLWRDNELYAHPTVASGPSGTVA